MINDNDSIRLIFGLKLKTLRQEKGLNYNQLAQATGMAVSYLHDIESGKKYPKADKIIALAKALGVDYNYMVSLSANKRLQPIIELISSDFMSIVPWEHFGLSPATLLDLFTNTPDKITAFISTLLKLSRSVEMSTENFYTSALRSYQDLHDNYFEELEVAANEFRQSVGIDDAQELTVERLEIILNKSFGISVDRKKITAMDELKEIRSFYSAEKKVLYVNKGLSTAQERFLLGREIAFQQLKLLVRPYETILQNPASFEVLLNNFKASYFASALLMPEDSITEDINRITSLKKWNEKAWIDFVDKYDVTPEMLIQRLTNILPGHFGIDQLFFLRMSVDMRNEYYDMTKELHLSQLHNPHANLLQEHYCRRWLAITAMKEAYNANQSSKLTQPLVHVQISEYWQTHSRYLCITYAKPQKDAKRVVSVTLGILIDQKLLQRMPFVNDKSIPVKTVHTTCERCGIMDCKERAIAPIFIQQQEKKEKIKEALLQLGQK